MSEHTFGKSYSQFVNALIFIFPVVINSVKAVGDIVLFILAVMGIFIAISKRLSPFSIKDIKVFSYLTSGYFLAVCLSVLFSWKALELVHFISRDLHFLFAPFIALALYKAEININCLLAGIKAGLIVLGIIVIYQLFSGAHIPASGVMNNIVFGNIAVLMFLFVIIFFQKESFKYSIFTLLSLLSGLFLIAESGSRTAWVSLLLLSVVYLFFCYKQKAQLNKISMIIATLVIASALSIGGFNQYVNNKVLKAYAETSNWLLGDESPTSVGQRLEMYKVAIDNVEDIPFFGYGLRTSNIVLFNKDNSSSMKDSLIQYNHLHNAYLTNYYNGGIILFGALLLLIFVPLRIFIKAMRQNMDDPILIAGTLLALGYASFGMFNVLMGDVFMNAFYVFFLAIFLLLIDKSTKVQ